MYTKIKAQQIFNGYSFTGEQNVLVLEKDKVQDIVREEDAGENILSYDGLLVPGFVNAHCHLELSHLENKIPKHTGLVNFVEQVLTLRFQPADKEAAMRNACRQMLDSGTIAVGDICNTSDSIPLKRQSEIYWQNFIETSGFVDSTAKKRLEQMELVANEFSNSGLQSTIVPHAPYSVSRSLFQLISEVSAAKTITIHNQECEAENELYQSGSGPFLNLYRNLGIAISSFTPTGKSSLQSWLSYFNNHRVIAVHNTFLSEEDLAAGNELVYCICINANLYIENKLPPVELLLKHNAFVVIGTDSLASNTKLDMWYEVQQILRHFPSVTLEKALAWATINGAKALGIENKFGSFEKGKQPGVILIKDDSAQRLV